MRTVATVFAFFVGFPALSRKTAVGAGAAILLLLAGTPAGAAERAATTTSQFAAQSRSRIVVHPRRRHPGPSAKRHCVSWLAKEYRASGPVVTPQMRCWWQ